MLVLSRRLGEQVQIGDDITITVVRITNQGIRIGIQAPSDAVICRAELLELLQDATNADEESVKIEIVEGTDGGSEPDGANPSPRPK